MEKKFNLILTKDSLPEIGKELLIIKKETISEEVVYTYYLGELYSDNKELKWFLWYTDFRDESIVSINDNRVYAWSYLPKLEEMKVD